MKCFHRRADAGEGRLSHMLDENVLRRGCAALHAVEHNNIRARFHGQCCVKVGPSATDFDVDRNLPASDFAQLQDLDFQIIWAGPVGVTTGRTLVDALGQVAHLGNPVADLLTQQHAAAARLGALADHDLDGIRPSQVVGVHAVAGGQVLVDQLVAVPAFFLRHAAVTGGRRRSSGRRATAERFLGWPGQCAKAHASDGDWNIELNRVLGVPGTQAYGRFTLLPVAFERVSRN